MKRPFKPFSGFTLIELLVTLAIIAIISAVVVPNYMSSQTKAKDDNAVARASVLDLAKTSFVQDRGSDARKDWNDADGRTGYPGVTPAGGKPKGMSLRDQEKYDLLRPYLSTPPVNLGFGMQLKEYTPIGYFYTLGELNGATLINRIVDGSPVGPNAGNKVTLKVTKVTLPGGPIGIEGGDVTGGGQFDPSSPTYNSTTQISAEAFTGYQFTMWTISGGSLANPNLATTDVILPTTASNPVIAQATFTYIGANNLQVVITTSSGGTTNPAPNSYPMGSIASVSPQPDAANNYEFTDWTIQGIPGQNDSVANPYPIPSSATDSIYIRAHFAKKKCTITANSAGNGAASPAPPGMQVSYGSSATVSATPAAGYQFSNWTEGGTAVPNAGQSYTFTASGNRDLVANFIPSTQGKYTVTINAQPASVVKTLTITPVPSGPPGDTPGTTFAIATTPKAGYQFVGWSGGTGGLFDNPYSATTNFTLGFSNATLTANFIQGGEQQAVNDPTKPISEGHLYGYPSDQDGAIRGVSNTTNEIFIQVGGINVSPYYDGGCGNTYSSSLPTMYVYDLKTDYLKRTVAHLPANYGTSLLYNTSNDMRMKRDCTQEYESNSDNASWHNVGFLWTRDAVGNVLSCATYYPNIWVAPSVNCFLNTNNAGTRAYSVNSYSNGCNASCVYSVSTAGGIYNYQYSTVQNGNYSNYYAWHFALGTFTNDDANFIFPTSPSSLNILNKDNSYWSGLTTLPNNMLYSIHISSRGLLYVSGGKGGSQVWNSNGGDGSSVLNGQSGVNGSGPGWSWSSTHDEAIDVYAYPSMTWLYSMYDNGSVLTDPTGKRLYVLNYHSKQLDVYDSTESQTVTATSNDTAKGTVTPASQSINLGDYATVTATVADPSGGNTYGFRQWINTVNNAVLSTSATYQFQVMGNTSLQAQFEYLWTVNGLSEDTSKGTVSPASQSVLNNDTAALSVTLSSGQQVDKWVEMPSGAQVSAAGLSATALENWTTPAITATKTYQASFIPVYTLAAAPDDPSHGTATPTSQTAKRGESKTITVTPTYPYYFVKLIDTADGSTVPGADYTATHPITATTITISNIQASKNYQAVFAKTGPYTINTDVPTFGGTASVRNPNTGVSGASVTQYLYYPVTLTATAADPGYDFVHGLWILSSSFGYWSTNEGNTYLSNANPLTVTATGNQTYSAMFSVTYPEPGF